MPMRGELRPVTVRSRAPATGWAKVPALLADPDFQSVVLFCAIGFLLTFNAIAWFPGFGQACAELAVFP